MNKLRLQKLLNCIVLSSALLSSSLVADDTTLAQKGYDIVARADRSDRGFADSRVQLEMVLRNAAGVETRRQLEITTLELPDESVGDKSLIVFSAPADINGTALLSHAQILDPDNQWLFLPALKRTKRISSKNHDSSGFSLSLYFFLIGFPFLL